MKFVSIDTKNLTFAQINAIDIFVMDNNLEKDCAKNISNGFYFVPKSEALLNVLKDYNINYIPLLSDY